MIAGRLIFVLVRFLFLPLGGALCPPLSLPLHLLSLLLIPLIYLLTTFPPSLKANNNNAEAVYMQPACVQTFRLKGNKVLQINTLRPPTILSSLCRFKGTRGSIWVLLPQVVS